jgi:hypothetical protein
MEREKDTRFKPGQSGNPSGRAPGSGWVGKAREDLRKAWDGTTKDGRDGIRHLLLEKAKGGDMTAVRIVAERVCPPIKASEAPAPISLHGETLTDKAHSLIDAVADGSIAPSQAAQLLQGLGAVARIIETDEILRRIAALEERQSK